MYKYGALSIFLALLSSTVWVEDHIKKNQKIEVKKIPDVAEAADGDIKNIEDQNWQNLVDKRVTYSEEEAILYAQSVPEVTHFFRVRNAVRLVLRTSKGEKVLDAWDTLFFKGIPRWGEAKGYADGYELKNRLPSK